MLPWCCPEVWSCPRARFREGISNLAELLTKAKIDKFILVGMPDGKTQAVLWDSAVTGLGLRLRIRRFGLLDVHVQAARRWPQRGGAQTDARRLA